MPPTPRRAAFTTEVVAIADLKPHPGNYRIHPADQLEHIAQSLREHGQYRNVVVAKDLTILAGHGVVEAATGLGWKKITVRKLRIGPKSQAALKILTGDNEIGRLADVDDRLLSEHLKSLAEMDSLLGTGFDALSLSSLVFVTRPEGEIQGHDAAAQWAGLPALEIDATRYQLVLAFESEEDREKLIAQLELVIAKKTRQTWSAWWPPRPREDLSSLRFVANGAEPE